LTLPNLDPRLFEIATKPLAVTDWLDPDADMAAQLAEKERLRQSHFDETFAALDGSAAAQAELLALLINSLPERFPALWQRHGESLMVVPTGAVVAPSNEPALLTASRLVQDDLLILERSEAGWRLTAGSLSFPSSWRLTDKIGLPLDLIHDPVPGFGPGTRAAIVMARMFDALRPDMPMIRWNWSLYGDDGLFHPQGSDPNRPRFGIGERADPVFLRVERQTLRKLPQTGAIAFTIRISIINFDDLGQLKAVGPVAAALRRQLEALSPEQLAYKGLSRERERALERLVELEQLG